MKLFKDEKRKDTKKRVQTLLRKLERVTLVAKQLGVSRQRIYQILRGE